MCRVKVPIYLSEYLILRQIIVHSKQKRLRFLLSSNKSRSSVVIHCLWQLFLIDES